MQNEKNKKMNNFGNFCQFFDIFTETLEQNIRKSQKICFLDGKEEKIKKKLEIFKFLRKSVLSQGYSL